MLSTTCRAPVWAAFSIWLWSALSSWWISWPSSGASAEIDSAITSASLAGRRPRPKSMGGCVVGANAFRRAIAARCARPSKLAILAPRSAATAFAFFDAKSAFRSRSVRALGPDGSRGPCEASGALGPAGASPEKSGCKIETVDVSGSGMIVR